MGCGVPRFGDIMDDAVVNRENMCQPSTCRICTRLRTIHVPHILLWSLSFGLVYLWSTPKTHDYEPHVLVFRQTRIIFWWRALVLTVEASWRLITRLVNDWWLKCVKVPHLSYCNRLVLQYHMNYPLVIKHSLLENPSFSSMNFLSTDARVSSGRPSQTCLITAGYSTQCESPRTGEGRGYAFITFKKLEEARKFVGYRPLVVVVAWQDGEYLTEENRVLSHLMFSFAVITSMNIPNHIPK